MSGALIKLLRPKLKTGQRQALGGTNGRSFET